MRVLRVSGLDGLSMVVWHPALQAGRKRQVPATARLRKLLRVSEVHFRSGLPETCVTSADAWFVSPCAPFQWLAHGLRDLADMWQKAPAKRQGGVDPSGTGQ